MRHFSQLFRRLEKTEQVSVDRPVRGLRRITIAAYDAFAKSVDTPELALSPAEAKLIEDFGPEFQRLACEAAKKEFYPDQWDGKTTAALLGTDPEEQANAGVELRRRIQVILDRRKAAGQAYG